MTRFGCALHDLNIEIIYANSSQAKGRAERMNLTLQYRLVKKLWFESIDMIAAANDFLPGYIDAINDRFAREPINPTDTHRTLTEQDDLVESLSRQETRTVSNSLSVQYDRVLYPPAPGDVTNGLGRKRVTVRCSTTPKPSRQARRRVPALLCLRQGRQRETGRYRLEQASNKKAPGRYGQRLIGKKASRQRNPAVR